MALATYAIGAILSGVIYVIIIATVLAKENISMDEIINEHLSTLVFIGFVVIAFSWVSIICYFIGFIGIYTYKRVKGKQDATTTEPIN